MEAANQESPEARLFCHVLHDTGCRPSEALALTARGVQLTECTITFRTLKKRTHDGRGRLKQPQYRAVPVSSRLAEKLDLVFNLRKIQSIKQGDDPLWSMSRPTAYRLVKRVMARANIAGHKQRVKVCATVLVWLWSRRQSRYQFIF